MEWNGFVLWKIILGKLNIYRVEVHCVIIVFGAISGL